jgi:hypothetical protein
MTAALTLTACGASLSTGQPGRDSASAADAAEEKTKFKLGESSPAQESQMQASAGATFTVKPTRVVLGTKADIDRSGLDLDREDGPRVPVYVWSTFTHKTGPAMALGDMDDDLAVKTDTGERTRALIDLLGQAKWPHCPPFDPDKELAAGQSESICSVFLVPQGQKAAAVELSQGFYAEPLEWSVD